MKTISKPEPSEYAPYTIMYIGLLPDDAGFEQDAYAIESRANVLATKKHKKLKKSAGPI
jgi:hypothetical protein